MKRWIRLTLRSLVQLRVAALIAASLLSVSCKSDRPLNTNAIWLWSTHMKEAPVQEWAQKGIGHVMLNEAAFWRTDLYGIDDVYAFAAECRKYGVKPHVWIQCFSRNKKWTFPVDEDTMTLKQEYFDDMVQRAEGYIKAGFEGIHLDYIRFCGNAEKFNCPDKGLTAVGVVNECCRQIHDAVKAINPDAIVSAALMPEISSESRYGQRPSEMAQWIDVLMPMIYRYDYYGENKTTQWVEELTKWFVENKANAQVWVGIQTYSVNVEEKRSGVQGGGVYPLDADAILHECQILKDSGADGVVLFRHGLGTLPDLNGFWDSHE